MTHNTVHDHKLPTHLVSMLTDSQWARMRQTAHLDALPIEEKEVLTFLSIHGMISNTKALREAVERGEGPLLGLTLGPPRAPGFIDVMKTVIIAVNHGQEAIALDYSREGEPRVVATNNDPNGHKWVEIAESFDELLILLKVR